MSGMGGSPLDGEISEVLEFEGRVMDQCGQRLPDYQRRARKYGVELRPMLVQLKEGLGNRAAVYPLREKGRLPGRYASRLTIYAYRDGQPMTRKLEKGQKEYLVSIFWLVRGKPGRLTFAEDPLEEFDRLMNQMLARMSDFT